MRRISKVLLITAAALAIPATVATTAGATPRPESSVAGGVHLDVQLGGLHGVVHADNCGVYEKLTGRLLHLKQSLVIGC